MGAVLGLDLEVQLSEGPLSIRLIALGTQGYKNLMKISTLKMMGTSDWEAFQHLLADLAILVPYFEGINF